MMQRRRQIRRRGFTFVELMMVVAIITVLVALLLGGLAKVVQLQGRTETMSDITQMAQALEAARAPYNDIAYYPSRLVLYNEMARYTTLIDDTNKVDPSRKELAKQTGEVFRRMFGRRALSNPVTVSWGAQANNKLGILLEGPECLVFYLGGMMENGRMVGFAKDPQNPTKNSSSSTDRIGPFFQFKQNRLFTTGVASGYPRYGDPYRSVSDAHNVSVYVLFGARATNLYDVNDTFAGLAPYKVAGSSPEKWVNPTTYQIISAGRNKLYGSGGDLVVANNAPARSDDPSSDNLTNFSSTELSNPVE